MVEIAWGSLAPCPGELVARLSHTVLLHPRDIPLILELRLFLIYIIPVIFALLSRWLSMKVMAL